MNGMPKTDATANGPGTARDAVDPAQAPAPSAAPRAPSDRDESAEGWKRDHVPFFGVFDDHEVGGLHAS